MKITVEQLDYILSRTWAIIIDDMVLDSWDPWDSVDFVNGVFFKAQHVDNEGERHEWVARKCDNGEIELLGDTLKLWCVEPDGIGLTEVPVILLHKWDAEDAVRDEIETAARRLWDVTVDRTSVRTMVLHVCGADEEAATAAAYLAAPNTDFNQVAESAYEYDVVNVDAVNPI